MPPRPCLPPPGTMLHAVADDGHTATLCGVAVPGEASRSGALADAARRSPAVCPTCATGFTSRTGTALQLG